MRKPVISDRAPRRKRAGLVWWALRRFGALLATLAVLSGVSWLAPQFRSPAQPPAVPRLQTSAPEPLFPDAVMPEAPAPLQPSRPRRPPSASLQAQPEPQPFDDLVVLSAAELAAISQARDDGAPQFAHAAQAATTPRETERARDVSDEQDQGRQSRRRHGRR